MAAGQCPIPERAGGKGVAVSQRLIPGRAGMGAVAVGHRPTTATDGSAFSCDSPGPRAGEFHAAEAMLSTRLRERALKCR